MPGPEKARVQRTAGHHAFIFGTGPRTRYGDGMIKERNGAALDDVGALVEFMEAQAPRSLPELRDRIRRYGDLRFVLSRPLRELDPAPGGGPAAARPPACELSPETKKAVRRARPRKIAPALNAGLLLSFWALLFFISVRFFEFPFNYILGAAFIAPVALELAPLLMAVLRRTGPRSASAAVPARHPQGTCL